MLVLAVFLLVSVAFVIVWATVGYMAKHTTRYDDAPFVADPTVVAVPDVESRNRQALVVEIDHGDCSVALDVDRLAALIAHMLDRNGSDHVVEVYDITSAV